MKRTLWVREIAAISILFLVIIHGSTVFGQNIDSIGHYYPDPTYGIAVQGNYAYLLANSDFGSWLWIINISDPASPSPVYHTHLPGGIALSLAVVDGYAYIANTGSGLATTEISDPSHYGVIRSYPSWGSAANVFWDGSYLYLLVSYNGSGYLRIIDVSNPGFPSIIGSLNINYMGRDVFVAGNYAYISTMTYLDIVDITVPTNPTLISSINPTGAQNEFNGIYVKNSTLFLSAGYSGLMIYDVSNPDNLSLLSETACNGAAVGVKVDSNFAYVLGPFGLKVLDISNLESLIPAGAFPSPVAMEGIYSLNGYLYLSSYLDGLYILRFTPQFGSINGVVYDSLSLDPVSDAIITITPSLFADTTDSQGNFAFHHLYNTSYKLNYSHPDYYPDSSLGVSVEANDTTSITRILRHHLLADVGVSAILIPSGRMHQDSVCVLKSRVINMGTEPQSFNVIFNIAMSGTDTILYADTVSILSMPPFSVDTVTFSRNFTPFRAALYNLVSYTDLNGDEYHLNDTTVVTLTAVGNPYLIYGNRDGSVITVSTGDTLELPVWGATARNDAVDTVFFMHLPLASNDSFIVSRMRGFFPDTLVGRWDDRSFLTPTSMGNGWTNQSMLAMDCLSDPCDPRRWFWTNGDTVLICTFKMVVTSNAAYIGDTISPFRSGHDPINGDLLWGMVNGVSSEVPITTYPRLFINPLAGCYYTVGDINGSGQLNGLDVIYGVAYFKGGPVPPYRCNCPSHGFFYAAGDVNADCRFDGLDITYLVSYFKGGPAPHPCPSCPPR